MGGWGGGGCSQLFPGGSWGGGDCGWGGTQGWLGGGSRGGVVHGPYLGWVGTVGVGANRAELVASSWGRGWGPCQGSGPLGCGVLLDDKAPDVDIGNLILEASLFSAELDDGGVGGRGWGSVVGGRVGGRVVGVGGGGGKDSSVFSSMPGGGREGVGSAVGCQRIWSMAW